MSDEVPLIIEVAGETLERKGTSVGILLLGTYLTLSNRSATEIRQKVSAAWDAVYRCTSFGARRHIPRTSRVQLLEAVVGSAFFWRAVFWNPTREDLRVLL